MSHIYNTTERLKCPNDEYNDYVDSWDTEMQQPIYNRSLNINNNDEYDHYVDNYEIALTNQEHMLEDEYNKTHVPGVFSTIGFVIFIVKAVTGFITN